jgi:hypothetical protein
VTLLPALPVLASAHGLFRDATPLEWALYVGEALVTIAVLWFAVRWTVEPGEEAPDHVKRDVLEDDDPAPARPRTP